MDNKPYSPSPLHALSLESLTKRQCGLLNSHMVDIDNRFNEVFPAFDPINSKFHPGNRIVDLFPNHFSFYLFSRSSDHSFKSCIQQLNTLAIESFSSLSDTLVITDASVKNNVASSIAHIHVFNKPVVKTLYHAINVTFSEAKFFTIRCSINHTILLQETSKIIVVTDSIHVTKNIWPIFAHASKVSCFHSVRTQRILQLLPHKYHQILEVSEQKQLASSQSCQYWHQIVQSHFSLAKQTLMEFQQKIGKWQHHQQLEDDLPSVGSQRKEFPGTCW